MRFGTRLASASCAALAIAVVGALGLAAHQPWLFPSLAPTAMLQSSPSPGATARPWNAVVGHGCAVLAGCVGVTVAGARHAPAVITSGHLTAARFVAAVVAVALTVLLTELAHARHAPAAATTMLFAEGSYQAIWRDVLLVAAGVALTVVVGEMLRRIREALLRRAATTVNAGLREPSSPRP